MSHPSRAQVILKLIEIEHELSEISGVVYNHYESVGNYAIRGAMVDIRRAKDVLQEDEDHERKQGNRTDG